MFHIVTFLLFSTVMFAAVYQFWFNKYDIMMNKLHVFNITKFCVMAWWGRNKQGMHNGIAF